MYCLIAVILSLLTPGTALSQTSSRWLTLEGNPDQAPGHGRRIVFVAGDEEYRSEEALPLLARILHGHGFECHVLFSQNPATGEIDPGQRNHLPGLHLLEDADLLVLFVRFRELDDSDMDFIVDYVRSGKPVTGIRTSTHAFHYAAESTSRHASWGWNADDPPGGFGGDILGETWVAHHGQHGVQATRGVIESEQQDHPILRGVRDVFGPTDVYAIRGLPDDACILLRGQVLTGLKSDDAPETGTINHPMMPLAWIRERAVADGPRQRIFVTTMGAAEDWSSQGLRQLFANATLWQLGDEAAIPPEGLDVRIIHPWTPSPYGFGTHRRGQRPQDLRTASPAVDAPDQPAAVDRLD